MIYKGKNLDHYCQCIQDINHFVENIKVGQVVVFERACRKSRKLDEHFIKNQIYFREWIVKKAAVYNSIHDSERKRKTNFTKDMVEDLIMNGAVIIQRDAKYDGQYFKYDMLNETAFEKVRNKLRQAMKDYSSGRFKTLLSPNDVSFDTQLFEDNDFTKSLERVFMRSSVSKYSELSDWRRNSILDISVSSIEDDLIATGK